jgi:parallel beta-helix repeat protein
MPSPRMAVTILLVTSGALLAVPGSASAQPVCGETITEDTTLTADLICAEGDGVLPPGRDDWWNPWEYGLLIGADGVTLDLNGHLVGAASWPDQGIGVFGHSDVTIKNGRTSHVALVDTTDSRLIGVEAVMLGLTRSDRNRIADSVGRVGLSASDDSVVQDNTAMGEGGGVTLYGSDRNVVRRNTVCGGMGGPLLVAQGSDANLIKDNSVPDTLPEWGECASTYSAGIEIRADTAGNRLIGNTVLGVPNYAVPGEPVPSGSGDGIYVESPATTLRGNTANFNDGYGIEAVAGVKSGGNYARGNGNPLQCLNVKCLLRPRGLAP